MSALTSATRSTTARHSHRSHGCAHTIVDEFVEVNNTQTVAQRIGVKVSDGKVETIAETVTAILRNAIDEAKIRAFLAKRSAIMSGDITSVLSDYGYTVRILHQVPS